MAGRESVAPDQRQPDEARAGSRRREVMTEPRKRRNDRRDPGGPGGRAAVENGLGGDVVRHRRLDAPIQRVQGPDRRQFLERTQAPPGKHAAFMWQKLPFDLAGDATNWDRQRDAVGRAMLAMWTEYAPNLRECMIDSFVRSPLDVARALPNMQRGDLLIGAFTNDQVGYNRPFPGAGHYRGCFDGLYLCGSCCHPGGNVTGLPGYNAAQVIYSDLDIAASWLPEPVAVRLMQRRG